MNSVLVSIIIPHFNRAEIIKQTLQSVFEQTYTRWEVVIVDDNSDEEQLCLLKEAVTHHKVSVFQRQGFIKGPSACRNQGAQVAKGKYLIFLDSDDLLAPYCLANRVKAMEKFPELCFGVFLMQEFQSYAGDKRNIYNLVSLKKEEHLNSFLKNMNPWNVTCPIWNRESFLALGGFDDELFYMEDPELHVRALLKDSTRIQTFYHLPVDCYYRVNYHDETKADFYENSIRYRILFYEKLCDYLKQKQLLKKYKCDIQIGLMTLFKSYMIYRINLYPKYYEAFIQLISKYKIFSSYRLGLLQVTSAIWSSSSYLVRVLKLRGLTYHMLS